MQNDKLKIGLIILVIAGLFSAASLVFGQNNLSVDQEINDLNQKILDQKKQINDLKTRQQEYQTQIEKKQKDKVNLSNQISILDNYLAKNELDIETANLEIDKTMLEIKKTEIDSNNLDKSIEAQKNHIATLLRLVYKQDQISALEMLLLNDSLTEFLNQAKYLQDANKEILSSVDKLKADKEEVEKNKASLEEQNKELAALKSQLEEKKNSLSYDQESKNYLLEVTRSSEQEYQALLQKAKRAQLQAESEVAGIEQLIRQKMSQKDQNRLNNGNNTIAWPVPKNTIVTQFHDPEYPYRNIIGEHPAVDIRAKQGTVLTAAADGYVAKVKFDGSKNYAYIMIIHGDGLATVYGHVSAVYVTPDQYVTQGQAIGRSGGMPGGIGSGPFTTGPHLHFEVRLNGLPVDPEKYLP
ncbi:MAG: murein hydrolase activator EnvC family protein [Patescibacteria group bacterium]